MNRYLHALTAILLPYQTAFGAGESQSGCGSDISGDINQIEGHLKTAERMGDLEENAQKTITIRDKLTFFIILSDSSKPCIDSLTEIIQSKTDYRASLLRFNQKQPGNFYYLILERKR